MNKDWKDKRAVWRTNNLMEENSRRNSLPQSRISSIKDLLQPRSRSRKDEEKRILIWITPQEMENISKEKVERKIYSTTNGINIGLQQKKKFMKI